jgi:hypothetical protein
MEETKMKTINLLAIILTGLVLPGATVFAQDCVECRQTYRIAPRQAVVRTWQETEIVKQLQWQQIEVEVPIVRTYETREVFARETRQRRQRRQRRVGSVNWGCVAAGLQAFANCNFQKKQSRQSRSGGLLSRLLFWR